VSFADDLTEPPEAASLACAIFADAAQPLPAIARWTFDALARGHRIDELVGFVRTDGATRFEVGLVTRAEYCRDLDPSVVHVLRDAPAGTLLVMCTDRSTREFSPVALTLPELQEAANAR
jgi:hypothetical protein